MTTPILLSIISSFSVLGKKQDEEQFPAKCEHVEAYAFMQKCLPGAPPTTVSAIQHMADLYLRRKIDDVAEYLDHQFKGKSIVAFATFLPEITGGGKDSQDAVDALSLLIEVARKLNSFGSRHMIKTLQLVSGSRISGVLQVDPQRSQYLARRLTYSTSIDRLLPPLKILASRAISPTPIFLAVELEPGPLFVVSDTHAITHFCKLIDNSNDSALKRCVGLNLDIPHWHFLSCITPEWLGAADNEYILKRIVHSHICDHHIGHLCDAVPDTFNEMETFSKWISLLRRRALMPKSEELPEYSGFVSCEMEACKEPEMLKACYERVLKLL